MLHLSFTEEMLTTLLVFLIFLFLFTCLFIGFSCVDGYANATNQGQLNSSCTVVIHDGAKCTETTDISDDSTKILTVSYCSFLWISLTCTDSASIFYWWHICGGSCCISFCQEKGNK